MAAQPKWMTITGWVIQLVLTALMTMSAVMKLLSRPEVAEQFVGKFGYIKEHMTPIGITEACCIVLALIPRTAVIGTILVTGYLGGAVATHLRVQDPFIAPAIVGAFFWLALLLRDPRIRALLPFTRPMPRAGA